MHRVDDLSTDDDVDMYDVWITIVSGSDMFCMYFVCKVVVNLGWKINTIAAYVRASAILPSSNIIHAVDLLPTKH